MGEMLRKKGFSFLEILSPCPTLYQRRNRLGGGLEALQYYKENSVVRHGANTKEVGITYQGPITVGKFVDTERPTFLELLNQQLGRTLDSQYVGCGGDRVRD
jgi:2-oxoglutarate ferredoxin oxidoreductase subunit beta